MRPFRVRVVAGEVKKIKSNSPSSSIPSAGISSEIYIDYTNFKDGYVMVYDAGRNRYYYVNPDEILNNSFEQNPPPDIFVSELSDEIEQVVDIDLGEY